MKEKVHSNTSEFRVGRRRIICYDIKYKTEVSKKSLTVFLTVSNGKIPNFISSQIIHEGLDMVKYGILNFTSYDATQTHILNYFN